jgi:hypothetical protein
MTDKPVLHVVVVTGQMQANLIPILQLKPDVVVLVVSIAMKDNAEYLKRFLVQQACCLPENIVQIDEMPDSQLTAIEDKALSIITSLQDSYPHHSIVYNATGGTKLMVLGLYEAFVSEVDQVIYTDMGHERIEIISPRGAAPIPIEHVLSIESYLLSMGQKYRRSSGKKWQERALKRKAMAKWLGSHADQLGPFFGEMNFMTQDAVNAPKRGEEKKIVNPHQKFRNNPRGVWLEAVKKCKEYNLCVWDQKLPDSVYFDDVDGATFLGGVWLEEYVWHLLTDLNPDEVLANVEFTELGAPKADIRNEIDCIAADANRLLMIECKTGDLRSNESKTIEVLYKMHTLKQRSAGLYGDSCLISARALSDSVLKRAKEYNISVFFGAGLKDLKVYLKAWKLGKR